MGLDEKIRKQIKRLRRALDYREPDVQEDLYDYLEDLNEISRRISYEYLIWAGLYARYQEARAEAKHTIYRILTPDRKEEGGEFREEFIAFFDETFLSEQTRAFDWAESCSLLEYQMPHGSRLPLWLNAACRHLRCLPGSKSKECILKVLASLLSMLTSATQEDESELSAELIAKLSRVFAETWTFLTFYLDDSQRRLLDQLDTASHALAARLKK